VRRTAVLIDWGAKAGRSREPSANTLGALAALRRAALKAQREAIETVGSFPIWQDGKVVYVTEVQFSEEEQAQILGEAQVPDWEAVPSSN
jgi:hypothetical protein